MLAPAPETPKADAPSLAAPSEVRAGHSEPADRAEVADPFAALSQDIKPASAPTRPDPPAVAQEVPPAKTPAGSAVVAEKTAKITMRSILPNPFADGADAPSPPTPRGEAGSALDVAKRENTPPATTQVGALAGGPAVVDHPLAPLPTKEESLRQIEEEAARREAEILAQKQGKSAEMRSQRLEEQRKFHEELREVLRTQGETVVADIDNLVKRYGYENDPVRFDKALRAWRFGRISQKEKVDLIRALELPETVILNFLSDDLHVKVKSRNGPRNEAEVRVCAARELLRYYPFPRPGSVQPAGSNTGVSPGTPPARPPAPSRRTVVSTPR